MVVGVQIRRSKWPSRPQIKKEADCIPSPRIVSRDVRPFQVLRPGLILL